MSNLNPGSKVTLKCLGALDGPRLLDGRTANATAGLTPRLAFPFTGARWEVVGDGPNRVVLKCLGHIEGHRFLDGRTLNGSVGLAPATDGIFSGTHWEVIDDGPNRVVLKCLGQIEGPRFLDGRTADGTVGLAPATDGIFSGTHWEVVPAPDEITPYIDLKAIQDGGRFIQVTGHRFSARQTVHLSWGIKAVSDDGPASYLQSDGEATSDDQGGFVHRIPVSFPEINSASVQALDVFSGWSATGSLG